MTIDNSRISTSILRPIYKTHASGNSTKFQIFGCFQNFTVTGFSKFFLGRSIRKGHIWLYSTIGIYAILNCAYCLPWPRNFSTNVTVWPLGQFLSQGNEVFLTNISKPLTWDPSCKEEDHHFIMFGEMLTNCGRMQTWYMSLAALV